MDHCLGCRACEPVCPADVKYGQLIEQARDALEDHPQRGIGASWLRRLLFRELFPHQRRLRLIGKLLHGYQKKGLRRIADAIGVMKLFPKHLAEMERILPEASPEGVIERIGTIVPAKGERIARVGLFRGCIMDVLFTDTNVNTAKLLAEAGFEVIIPEAQGCCGALHAHSGEMELSRELARRNVAAFRDANVDYVVSNAGGCGALLIEYGHLLKEDGEWAAASERFAERVKDVSQLLVEKGRVPDFGCAEADAAGAEPAPLRITYQDSCHLRNVMRSSQAPRLLMKRVAGAAYVELKESDRCCGSAGIYNVTQPEMSGQLLEHKMEHVNRTQAQVLLTSNPGCLLQMKLGIERHACSADSGTGPAGGTRQIKAMHIVDFLYERILEDRKEKDA
jgi:glycolate oxidase iron-sulfur subunit